MQKRSKKLKVLKELLKINFLTYFCKVNCQKYIRHSSRKQGSITLFFALTLTLILSFLFSLLEASRVETLANLAQRNLFLSLESAFGSYDVPLWQDYRMLFLDGGVGSQELDLTLLEGNIMQESWMEQKGNSFYHMALKNIEISGYTLATDYYGAAFEEQACKAIQEQLAQSVMKSLQEKLENGKKLAEDEQKTQEKWNSAKGAIKEAKEIESKEIETEEENAKEDERDKIEEGDSSESTQELPENPINFVDLWKKSPILTLVVENPTQISGKAISKQERLITRKKKVGNMDAPNQKAVEKLWFIQYLNYYFSCQNERGEGGSNNHALDYELEYCIGGKETDQKNLEKVVNELLLLRETGNFVTIMKDSKKQALALEIATAAVGFTGIPPLIQAVQIGILLAWSFVESILDVRCLLAGGTVPLVKNILEWKSDISLGQKAIEIETNKQQNEEGLSYREYLQILLLLVKEDVLVYRAMDVVEQNIRLLPKRENFHMDCLIQRVKAEGTYTSHPLFLGFVTTVTIKDGEYHFNSNSKFSY